MLTFGKYVIALLIWNLHFESLHHQRTFPKGKCFCICFLMNVEKICVLSYKKSKTSLHHSCCKRGPCPPAATNMPYPARGSTTAIQEADRIWKLCKTKCGTLYN